jgi:checkpoint serine/threonine-protein kinase
MEEPLVMFYTIELLRMVSALHAAGVLHADIKPDNLMVRSDPTELDDWGEWTPSQSRGGWEHKGLVLIDYGHCIDRTLYPPGTLFCGKCHSETFTCADMRADLPWGSQIDTHGIAVTVHCMLFGSWLTIVPCTNVATTPSKTRVRWKLREEFKKYWQRAIWEEVFDSLLNAGEDLDLDRLRHTLESYLRQDPRKSKEIRSLLVRQDVLLAEIPDDATE